MPCPKPAPRRKTCSLPKRKRPARILSAPRPHSRWSARATEALLSRLPHARLPRLPFLADMAFAAPDGAKSLSRRARLMPRRHRFLHCCRLFTFKSLTTRVTALDVTQPSFNTAFDDTVITIFSGTARCFLTRRKGHGNMAFQLTNIECRYAPGEHRRWMGARWRQRHHEPVEK